MERIKESIAKQMEAVDEQYSPGGTATDGYDDFEAPAVMEAAVAESAFDTFTSAAINGASDGELIPITDWSSAEMGLAASARIRFGVF